MEEGDRVDTGVPRIDPAQREEFAVLLDELGVDPKPSMILAYLAVAGEGRSAEIEEACDLRQPEVSQATKALREKGWVEATPEKTPGKGRPVNVYSLRVSLADIINEVEARKREEINKELTRIDKLRQISDLEPTSDQPQAERTVRSR